MKLLILMFLFSCTENHLHKHVQENDCSIVEAYKDSLEVARNDLRLKDIQLNHIKKYTIDCAEL
jgi:hypothetical protein